MSTIRKNAVTERELTHFVLTSLSNTIAFHTLSLLLLLYSFFVLIFIFILALVLIFILFWVYFYLCWSGYG
jgi:hypothetical protein